MPSEASTIGGGQSVEELRRELAGAREQQAAAAEILRVISSSPRDLQRVLAEIAASAGRLCDAYDVVIHRVDGDFLRLVAHNGPIPVPDSLPLTRGIVGGRAVLDGQLIQVVDLQAETKEYPENSDLAKRGGYRTILAVPLSRAGNAIGLIAIRRTEVRRFSDEQVALLKSFADQAVIAIENSRLFEEVQARTKELTESLEYQTATSEVLSVISKSPNDLQPVLDAIVVTAQRLCQAEYTLFRKREDDSFYHIKASVSADPQFVDWARAHPIAAGDGSMVGIVAAERQTMHFPDCLAEPRFTALAGQQQSRARTILGVPLLRGGEVIGVIFLARTVVQPFTDRQIALVTTFANQAVIAIENARLFEVEQASKRELRESLEYQTATSEVLGAISRTPTELQPVLAEICKTANRLCETPDAAIFLRDGNWLRVGSVQGSIGAVIGAGGSDKIALTRGFVAARAFLDREIVHVHDLRAAADEYPEGYESSLKLGHRTLIGVPLMRNEVAIGVMILRRSEVKPFTDKQIQVLKSFADQAVIAIENTRLFEAEQARTREVTERTRELTEALEQQTATADVLKVISRSALDLQRVLDALVESAARLCNAYDALIFQVFGDHLRLVAHHGQIPTGRPVGQRTLPLERGRIPARAVIDRQTIHVADVLAEADEYPESQKVALRLGWRTALAVPLVHAGEAMGVIFIRRAEVRPFTERQIELVNTFADQAVIAIENTRLFEAEQASKRELQESLQQQTATADVLKVISRSAFDLPRALDTLVESAATLCDSYDTAITQKEGDALLIVSRRGHIPSVGAATGGTLPLTHGSAVGRAILDQRTIHVADLQVETEEYPEGSERARRLGFHTILVVPLIRAGEAIGALVNRRTEVRPFTDRQIDLLKTFADQAVIAIENSRLFEEVQARTSELAKTVEDLEIASQHKSQFVANMSHELRTPLAAILGYAELIQEGFYEPQGPKSLDALTRIRSNGKHLLGLINTVLDVAKIESGQFTLNMAEYAIESVVETVRSATESLAQNKKLALKTEVAKSLPIGVGDEQRLTQVLLNLVGNAIKFTDSGEVRVTVKAVNGHFNLSVTDTGPGIPAEHQTRIFEQFHQVDSSNTKAKGGTGLGLAIAKQIVEMHGGRIWVESTVGKGSTFQMKIPARAEVARSG